MCQFKFFFGLNVNISAKGQSSEMNEILCNLRKIFSDNLRRSVADKFVCFPHFRA